MVEKENMNTNTNVKGKYIEEMSLSDFAMQKNSDDNLEFYKMEKGVNTITILGDKIKKINTQYGEKWVFDIAVENKYYLLAVSEKSKLFSLLRKAIKDGKRTISIVRAGEGTETKYDVV